MIDSLTVGGVDMLRGPWDMERVTGWFDTPGVRLETVDRLGHGEHTSNGRWSNRLVRITGLFHHDDCDDQQAERDRLAGLFHDGQAVEVRMVHGGLDLANDFRLADELKVEPDTDTLSDFDMLLAAVDPFLYAPEQVTFLHPLGTGIGLEYPLFHRGGVLTFGTGVAADDPIRNEGNAESWPVFLVVGDFPGGFEITVSGRVITWPWPTTKARPVEVRMDGAIFEAGSNMTHRASRRDWVSIPPGGVIAPEFRALQGGEGWCEVHHRNTYI